MSGTPADPDRSSDRDVDPGSETAELRARLAEAEGDLRLAKLQLSETERALWQFSAIFTHVGIPIIIADTEGRITDVNAEAERRWEKPRSELLGAHLSAIVPEHNHGELHKVLAACRGGASANDVARRLWDLPQSVRSTWLSLAPSRDRSGKVIGVVLAEDPRELKATGSLLESVNERLRDLALVDSLTKLANRRHFERQYRREFARAARELGALSLIMIDVDEFKAYNDTLGHPAGDVCLRRIADAIAGCLLRPADLLARYGGEEFVAILPGTEHHGAVRLGERIRAAVESTRTPHPKSEVSEYVTVSVGVGTAWVTPEFGRSTLRDEADRALYAAKRAGRNRVHSIDIPRKSMRRPTDRAKQDDAGVSERSDRTAEA